MHGQTRVNAYLHDKESTDFFGLLCTYKENIQKPNTIQYHSPNNSHNTEQCSYVSVAIVKNTITQVLLHIQTGMLYITLRDHGNFIKE